MCVLKRFKNNSGEPFHFFFSSREHIKKFITELFLSRAPFRCEDVYMYPVHTPTHSCDVVPDTLLDPSNRCLSSC